jgi:hypothetical protein
MEGCTDTSNPSNKLPMYTTPNPLGILKKIPQKLIPLVMRLTKLDRIAMEIILATITVPDKKLKSFMETKLLRLINNVEEPVKEAMDKLGSSIIEPLFRAIPFVNLTYIMGDIQKATEASDDVKGEGAKALNSIITEARELYEDIQGPSRTLSSLILGLGNYLEQVRLKLDNGEPLTKEDIAAINIYKEIGKDYDGPPTQETPKRAAARGIAAELIKNMREDEVLTGAPDPDRQLIKQAKNFLIGNEETTGAERKEIETTPKGSLIDLLLGENEEEGKEESNHEPRGRKVKKSHRKKSSTYKRSRARGSKKTRRVSRS